MILQALKQYYDRASSNSDINIAPEGWEYKEIPFLIVIKPDGSFYKFEDTRETVGKKLKAKSFLIPIGVKKTSGIAANLLWGNITYVFGIPSENKLKDVTTEKKKNDIFERAKKCKQAFITKLESELSKLACVKPVLRFLKTITLKEIEQDTNWEEIKKTDPFMTFKILGEDNILCRNEEVIKAIQSPNKSSKNSSICLVTGEKDEIARLHSLIKGVLGAQTSGANIVSFNRPAFISYGKEQGMNAPVGEKAAFAYVTALNTLLGKESEQKMTVGDSSIVFWSEKKTKLESKFSLFFKENKDNPNAMTEEVKSLIGSIHNGKYSEPDKETKFYILGLSPNASRISVRFWHVGTVAEFAENIAKHFEDLKIIKPQNESEHYPLRRLLENVATQNKSENIPPNIAGDFVKAIMAGTAYPATLLQAALRRIRSDTERRVKPVRAALIKAYLNRYIRFYDKSKKELTMALDKEQPSIGYQLGRLFATLAKIQAEAQGEINSTITDRYYASACASPVTVFSTLLRLKNHHLNKLENKGRITFFDKLLGEILNHLNKFPAHLDINEQGMFAIGYYHQWQDFFTKKSESQEQETIEENNN